MKLLRPIPAAMLCVLLAASGAAAQQAVWPGTYNFDENGGKNGGGTTIFVTHELIVFETDGGLRATLKSNGYQTSRDLNCVAKVSGQKLMVYFDSYGDDNASEIYDQGDLLLTLESKIVGGKPVILTYWGKILPIVTKHERPGKVYFTRSDTTRL